MMAHWSTYRHLLCAAVLSISFCFGCNSPDSPDCFKKAGSRTLEVREPSSEFHTLYMYDWINVVLMGGDEYRIEVEAPENLISQIKTEVDENGELTITDENTCNFVRPFELNYVAYLYGEVRTVFNQGSGNLTTDGYLDQSFFQVENKLASGTLDISIHCDSLIYKTHTGVSDCTLRGSSEKTWLFNQGFGPLDARGVSSTQAFVNNNSINDIYVKASEYLFCVITESGNVYYAGNPTQTDFDIQGEGSVISLD